MTSMELDARKANFIRKVLNDVNDEFSMRKLEQALKKIIEIKGQEELVAPRMCVSQIEFNNRIQEAVEDDDVITDEDVTRFYIRWATEK